MKPSFVAHDSANHAPSKIIIIGQSMGAYATIRHGALLEEH